MLQQKVAKIFGGSKTNVYLFDNQALTDFRKCFFYTRENYAKTIAVQFALDILWRISPKIVRWLVSLNITPFQNLDKTHSLVSPDKL